MPNKPRLLSAFLLFHAPNLWLYILRLILSFAPFLLVAVFLKTPFDVTIFSPSLKHLKARPFLAHGNGSPSAKRLGVHIGALGLFPCIPPDIATTSTAKPRPRPKPSLPSPPAPPGASAGTPRFTVLHRRCGFLLFSQAEDKTLHQQKHYDSLP